MARVPHRLQVLSIAAIMLVGVVGEASSLFFGTDPAFRLRVGMLLLALIAWPLYYAARHFPAGLDVIAERPRRRFSRLRRWTRELLREISRLNWTVVDVDRGFRNREVAKVEIDAIETRLYEIIGSRNTETIRNLAKLHVLASLNAERRIEKVNSVEVTPHPSLRDVIFIAIEVLPIGADAPLAISFALELDTGGQG